MATIDNLKVNFAVDSEKLDNFRVAADAAAASLAAIPPITQDTNDSVIAFGFAAQELLADKGTVGGLLNRLGGASIDITITDHFYHIGEEVVLGSITGMNADFDWSVLEKFANLFDVRARTAWRYQLTLGAVLVILLLSIAIMSS